LDKFLKLLSCHIREPHIMLKIFKVTPALLQDLAMSQSMYQNLSNESLVARNQIFLHTNQWVSSDTLGKPIFWDFYWSVSHKKDLVMVWVDQRPLWVDIEICKSRWEELFSYHPDAQYEELGWQTWENFYRLWTLKEAVIKLNLSQMDNLNKVKIISSEKILIDTEGIMFDRYIRGTFENLPFEGFSGMEWEWVYSLVKYEKDLTKHLTKHLI